MTLRKHKILKNGLSAISDILIRYLEEIPHKDKVLDQESMSVLSERMDLKNLLTQGGLTGDTLRQFAETYLAHGQGMQHPAYMGHQVSVPNAGGAWAELIHGVINNPMAIYEMGPSAATIELEVIHWMLSLTGWQDQDRPLESWSPGKPSGVLTHGGSLANLTCLLAARAAAAPDVWQKGTPTNLCILAPKSSHYCIERSAAMMGLGTDAIRWIPTDDYDRIQTDKIEEVYRQAMADGQNIIALVANACITSTGLHDDLETIGLFCSDKKLWLHVDGAHGASALLSKQHKHLLTGLSHARSMIWDAHKMLRVPALSAAVLFRDYKDMRGTFRQEGSYIFHEKDQPGIDTLGYTVECTKAALGTKIFMTLAIDGADAIGDYVNSRYQLAQDAYRYIQSLENYECLVKPESNILCFNYKDEDPLEIRKKLVAKGNFYITTTQVKDRTWLRLTLMHPDTSMKEIKELINSIRTNG